MPWTLTNPPDVVKNKPKHVIEACVLAANSALAKGLTEEEAIFACLSAAKRTESSSVTKAVKRPVPQHIQALLERKVQEPETQAKINSVFLGKSALPADKERTLVQADFNSKNQLVLTFDTGEKITTSAPNIEQNIEQYLSVSTNGANGPSVTVISDLTDTSVVVPQDGEVLMYEASSGLWKNKAVGAIEGDEVLSKRTDFVGETTIYKGEAQVGASEGSAVWRIRQLLIGVDGDVTEIWAGGTALYDKVWASRLTYSYS